MIAASLQTNLSATVRRGTTVTGGTSHTKGSYVELINSTSAEVQGIHWRALMVATAATDTGVLLDIADGTPGGGGEADRIPNLSLGGASARPFEASHGRVGTQPLLVSASKAIAARLQGTVASETAEVAVAVKLGCVHIEDVGTWVTYGASTAASRGTSVPEGSGAFGAWTEIGTTSEAHNLIIPSYDPLGDTTVSVLDMLVQLGFGATAPGSGGTAIDGYWHFSTDGNEAVHGPWPMEPLYAVIGSGVKLWARIASGGTENRGIAIHCASGTVVTPGSGGGSNNIF